MRDWRWNHKVNYIITKAAYSTKCHKYTKYSTNMPVKKTYQSKNMPVKKFDKAAQSLCHNVLKTKVDPSKLFCSDQAACDCEWDFGSQPLPLHTPSESWRLLCCWVFRWASISSILPGIVHHIILSLVSTE